MAEHKGRKLIKVELIHNGERQHYNLEETDYCYYYGDYTSGGGYACSPINQTIMNFKKREGDAGYHYKAKAIQEVANAFSEALKLQVLIDEGYTLIPIPPSKTKEDQRYDARMMQVLDLMKSNAPTLDIRDLIYQKRSRDSSQESKVRPTIVELADNYRINESFTAPQPTKIIIFDDVLTTGAHFKAVKKVLQERFPDVEQVIGCFYARTKR